MAKATIQVLSILHRTATRLAASQDYQWGHMGSCNCGFLAQEITQMHKNKIHMLAMQGHGDWCEQLNDYCPTSGLPLGLIISEMLEAGFDSDDLRHLERLSDPAVLRQLSERKRDLKHNVKTDVITYIGAWIQLLENQLLPSLPLPVVSSTPIPMEV